jgi:hypothetical protein
MLDKKQSDTKILTDSQAYTQTSHRVRASPHAAHSADLDLILFREVQPYLALKSTRRLLNSKKATLDPWIVCSKKVKENRDLHRSVPEKSPSSTTMQNLPGISYSKFEALLLARCCET